MTRKDTLVSKFAMNFSYEPGGSTFTAESEKLLLLDE